MSPEDRKSWAIKHLKLPDTHLFKLDVELWLQEQGIRCLDRINLDSLLMYRLEVSQAQTELLLNHRDIRLVDFPPSNGISYQQLNRDINSLPRYIPQPPRNAAKICILDSGVNTNHPLLSPAIADSACFITDQNAFDLNGHGTAVASIALYGDVGACNESNFWKPQFWIYNGKVLNDQCEFDINSAEQLYPMRSVISSTLAVVFSMFL
ncbi:S8 family serine peptidase [Photorhabdus stackebrandtii]|uniref:S8 family serine peptidase n=1 Tax=Photorhabdus stackebrandtii TaxID=1123042 RepID=UPI0024185334|nr:S8 family serine peptidase [Photorhabdus stackebrandtii]